MQRVVLPSRTPEYFRLAQQAADLCCAAVTWQSLGRCCCCCCRQPCRCRHGHCCRCCRGCLCAAPVPAHAPMQAALGGAHPGPLRAALALRQVPTVPAAGAAAGAAAVRACGTAATAGDAAGKGCGQLWAAVVMQVSFEVSCCRVVQTVLHHVPPTVPCVEPPWATYHAACACPWGPAVCLAPCRSSSSSLLPCRRGASPRATRTAWQASCHRTSSSTPTNLSGLLQARPTHMHAKLPEQQAVSRGRMKLHNSSQVWCQCQPG